MNEERYYQRSAVLLGALVQLGRVHGGAPGRLPANAETNTLNTAPTVARFPYLPISAPQASHVQASAEHHASADAAPKANGNGQVGFVQIDG